MVSEDSQHFRGLPEIHRLSDLRDLDETWHREVPSEIHQLDDPSKFGEVVSLRRSQWVSFEEWDDHVSQVCEPKDVISQQVLTMIVVATVAVHATASEERHHPFESLTTRFALNNDERRLDLPSQSHRGVAEDGAAEAALSVNETHEPSSREEPFLLVFRTPHIVTAVHVIHPNEGDMTTTASSEETTGFSSI